MLRTLIGLWLLTACSMGTVKTGGDKTHVYDHSREYSLKELDELSESIVSTAHRDPPVEKLERLFGEGQAPLKRFAIIVFESIVQPTRGGLAGEDKIYLSEAGKQLLTENFLHVWEEMFPMLSGELEYIPGQKVRLATSSKKFGSAVEDHVKSERFTLAPDDIFFRRKGQKTTAVTVLNARGMRDLSLVLVPATELMQGPKWSEHQKHYVNDLMKELSLDAAVIVKSELSWSASHVDKHSGKFIPEEAKIKISSSTLTSLSSYHQRLQHLKNKAMPNVTLCYRAYEGNLHIPVNLSFSEDQENFNTIQQNLLSPLLKSYKDLSIMTINRMVEDMRKTF